MIETLPRLIGLVLIMLAVPCGSARGQDTTFVDALAQRVSPLLPGDHWAVRAASRAEGMGLAPSFFPNQSAATLGEVGAALREAALNAEGGAAAPLAEGWLSRFNAEFRGEGGPVAGASRLGGSAGVLYNSARGGLAPAVGTRQEGDTPLALPDADVLRAGFRASARLGRGLAGRVDLAFDADRMEARQWEVVTGTAGLTLSAGRMPIGYGWGGDGGLVLGANAALPRVELRTTHAWLLGGVLRPLGRISASTFVSRLDETRHPTTPWLWGARVALRPHSRVTLGLNRASIFGGDSAKVTPGRVAGMLVGVLSSEFENQVVSIDGRYRIPSEALLPLTVFGEWAAEDAAGAWVEQPAFLLGVEAPGVPGIPELSLGMEGVRFAACCGHGAWYRHSIFTGHWAARDRPLGHDLAGAGSEAAARMGLDVWEARLRLHLRGFLRDRDGSPEDTRRGARNLFAPVRTGRSSGIAASADARMGGSMEASVHAFHEDGDGWKDQALELELRYLF